jgi:hypothetical protein
MMIRFRDDIEIASGHGSFVAWSKLGAHMVNSGSGVFVTGVVFNLVTSSTKPSESKVKGAPRLRNAVSASSNVDSTCLV